MCLLILLEKLQGPWGGKEPFLTLLHGKQMQSSLLHFCFRNSETLFKIQLGHRKPDLGWFFFRIITAQLQFNIHLSSL